MMSLDKLLIVDVDGVLTSGKKTYDNSGMPVFKEFYDKDFTALKEFRSCGYEVVWLSGDDFVNKKVAERRNYVFISAKGKSKRSLASQYIMTHATNFTRIIAVGDDIFDMELIDLVDAFYAPANAHWRLIEAASKIEKMIIASTLGGQGVIMEMSQRELGDVNLEDIIGSISELDKKEVF